MKGLSYLGCSRRPAITRVPLVFAEWISLQRPFHRHYLTDPEFLGEEQPHCRPHSPFLSALQGCEEAEGRQARGKKRRRVSQVFVDSAYGPLLSNLSRELAGSLLQWFPYMFGFYCKIQFYTQSQELEQKSNPTVRSDF